MTPTLFVPVRPDSVSIESEPAPLIEPGRPNGTDSLVRTPERFALEQFRTGEDMERLHNPPGALFAYQNAIKADSTLRHARYRLGLLLMTMGRPDQAERNFRGELRLDPRDSDASRELAIALSAQGKHAPAIVRLRGLVAREPRRDEHWYALGLAYANAGRMREAEVPFRRAIALGPSRPLEHRDFAVVLASLGRIAEARRQYGLALTLDDRDPSIWLNLGNLEARAGRADTALVAYRNAERRDSSYALAYEAQLKTFERLDRRDDVAELFLRWVTAVPDDTDLRLRAVRELAALDRRDRALEIARDGVRHDARSAPAHLILGLALEAYGSTRDALGEMRRAEAMFHSSRDSARARTLIATMRRAAPDSLRAMFDADSLAHPSR